MLISTFLRSFVIIGAVDFEEFLRKVNLSRNGSKPQCQMHQRHRFARSLGLLDGHLVYLHHCCCPSVILYISFRCVLTEFKCTISSSDIQVLPSLPSNKFESDWVVDLRRLPENVSLATCKFSIRALDAFRFRGIAGNGDDECFQGHN